jgi:tetratricopeptide (TPR) repeat protein
MADEQVDPALVDLFQEAVALARVGEHAEALAGYQAVLEKQRSDRLIAAPRFIATTQLQSAYALIDLGRYAEAELILDHVDASTFSGPQLYDFHFTRGNVLGALAKLREMFSAFVSAISTAEDLDDYTDRPGQCWIKILTFAVHAKDWHYVLELADKAEQVSSLRGIDDMRNAAIAARDIACAELGTAN